MSWVRFDDVAFEHGKVVAAGDDGGWLWVCGIAYCSRTHTDGFIPEATVARLTGLRGVRKATERLVEVGLWERVSGGYQVHDYLDYQPSAESLASKRRNAAKRVAKHRRNSKVTPLLTDDSDVTNALTHTGAGAGLSGSGIGVSSTGSQRDSLLTREQMNFAIGILSAIPTWTVDEVGIENCAAMYPGVDLLQAARLAVTWASDPTWEVNSAAASLRAALKKLDAESKGKPLSVKEAVRDARRSRRGGGLRSLMASTEDVA